MKSENCLDWPDPSKKPSKLLFPLSSTSESWKQYYLIKEVSINNNQLHSLIFSANKYQYFCLMIKLYAAMFIGLYCTANLNAGKGKENNFIVDFTGN